ncbi:MAG: peptidylprolyl isomerase [Hyphomicrobiaceae bacterium]
MKAIWSFLRREPLIHFIALAGLLFLANALFAGSAREVIRVDHATQEFLIKQQADLLLRPITEKEKTDIVESFVEEEILLREAKKRGLDNNSRVRRLLVQNMRFFLTGDLKKPTKAELRAFFEQNRKLFESPSTITLDHVFFANSEKVPEGVLDSLQAGTDPKTLGEDKFGVGRKIIAADRRQLVGLLGPDGARAVLATKDDRWHGPIISSRGAHFLRVAGRKGRRMPSFEAASSWIEGAWTVAKTREAIDRELAAMRPSYSIVIEARKGAFDD